jgi:hypothetical protein
MTENISHSSDKDKQLKSIQWYKRMSFFGMYAFAEGTGLTYLLATNVQNALISSIVSNLMLTNEVSFATAGAIYLLNHTRQILLNADST